MVGTRRLELLTSTVSMQNSLLRRSAGSTERRVSEFGSEAARGSSQTGVHLTTRVVRVGRHVA